MRQSPALMPRSIQQRRYDAFVAILRDAVSTPAGSSPNEPLVNLMMDAETFQQTVDLLFGDDDQHDTLDPASSSE